MINLRNTIGLLRRREPFAHGLARPLPEAAPSLPVRQQKGDRFAHRGGGARLDQPSVSSMLDDLWDAPRMAGDHGQPHGHRLCDRQAERLLMGGVREQIERGQKRADIRVVAEE